ncbi:MAG: urease accessory protein UreD [Ferruginibacter sp.]
MKARLHISTACRDGRSYLKECFFQPPFKVADITEDKSSAALRLMLMSASPGILSNDEYDIEIRVKQHTTLQLFTQSYQRLYSMRQQATQHTKLYVEKNACFSFIPHPQVPHKQSVFVSNTDIFLEENAGLVWGEIISCGRKLNGEVFAFSRYHSRTSIYRDNTLLIRENQLMQPDIWPVNTIGQMQGFTHQATLLFIHPGMTAPEAAALCMPCLSEEQALHPGITAAAPDVLLVRVLGHHAEQLFDLLNKLAAILTTKKEPVQ